MINKHKYTFLVTIIIILLGIIYITKYSNSDINTLYNEKKFVAVKKVDFIKGPEKSISQISSIADISDFIHWIKSIEYEKKVELKKFGETPKGPTYEINLLDNNNVIIITLYYYLHQNILRDDEFVYVIEPKLDLSLEEFYNKGIKLDVLNSKSTP